MFDLRPAFTQIPNVKISYNIGCLMDIVTGEYEFGKFGESLLNGGLGPVTGVVGIGNNFKSTIMHFMMLSPMAHFPESTADTYDTEINMNETRLAALADHVRDFNGENVVHNGRWRVTDKSYHLGNEWYEIFKKYVAAKEAAGNKIVRETPFINRDGKSLIRQIIPTFAQIDSFSEFETQDVADMQLKNELGESGGNTIHMRQGLAKVRFLSDAPKMIAKGNTPLLLTAHIGKDIPMDARAAPIKKLQFLKNGDKMKGVTDKFMFLTTNCWQCQNAAPLTNDTTKSVEYPRHSDDKLVGDTDLMVVTLVLLRSKMGRSGLMMQVLVSQEEGVLPSLSEFHYIKVNKFGLGGNQQNYFLDLLPEVKLSRTVVRGKIDKDAQLRRALTITAELCQMTHLWHDLPEGLLCTPLELYEDLKAMGYDWDTLLATRGWWTFNNDKHPVPFLSTMDLLRMRAKVYHPYWLPLLPGMEQAPPVPTRTVAAVAATWSDEERLSRATGHLADARDSLEQVVKTTKKGK